MHQSLKKDLTTPLRRGIIGANSGTFVLTLHFSTSVQGTFVLTLHFRTLARGVLLAIGDDLNANDNLNGYDSHSHLAEVVLE